MRILQLHDESWDSGIAHYALTLSGELKRRGHQVHFWAASGSFAAEQARKADLIVREVSRPWLSLPQLRSELARRGIELINAHTGSSHSLAAALAAGTGVPVVRTRGDTRAPAGHALARALAKRTRAFVAANRRIEGELKEAFPSARVELVLQGISPLAERRPPLPEEPVAGILGRLDPVKGHRHLLEAAAAARARLPQASLLVAGADQGLSAAKLREEASALGLNGAAQFLGFVGEASAFIARCRVGVVASVRSEAVSRAALEWMSLGRPVVATRVGCLPDLVVHGVTGLLAPPADGKALAQALLALLGDPARAAAMGEKAARRFDELFTLKLFGDRTEALYRELAGVEA